jgi:hypothetical protein
MSQKLDLSAANVPLAVIQAIDQRFQNIQTFLGLERVSIG